MNDFKHISVQKENAIKYLNVKSNGIYVDCTFGRGGHSIEILNMLNNSGLLISIDKDIEAYDFYKKTFPKFSNHVFVYDTFSNLDKILKELNINKVDGFLFDFGLSSPMLDNKCRGFSYKLDGPLDMRMNQNQKIDAKFIINNYSEKELTRVFKQYGEIKNPYYVIKEIMDSRKKKEINSTIELVEIIKKSVHKKEINQKKHFARQYFQALRIEVNNELGEIKSALKIALEKLSKKGRIVTISFHSLEEREVKNAYKKTLVNIYPKELPVNNIENEYKIINIKEKWASEDEINKNNRSRSSLLKVIERN